MLERREPGRASDSGLELAFDFASALVRGEFDQHVRQRAQMVLCPLAHEADLYPVAAQQIFALVAQEVTGFLKLPTDALGADLGGQRDRYDCGRSMRIRRDDLETSFANLRPQPCRRFLDLRKLLGPIRALERSLQRVNEI